MADKKTATAKGGENAIDPNATAPSNDKTRDPDAASAAMEPNSRQRVAEKQASRTGRGNGGADADAANNRLRAGVGVDATPDTLGERESVSPADTDAIWTNSSKDRWDVGQPSMQDLLKQRTGIEEQRRKRDEK